MKDLIIDFKIQICYNHRVFMQFKETVMNKAQNFTSGKIFSPLIRFALPVLLALFLQAMYSGVDLLIVGQFGGNNADIFILI